MTTSAASEVVCGRCRATRAPGALLCYRCGRPDVGERAPAAPLPDAQAALEGGALPASIDGEGWWRRALRRVDGATGAGGAVDRSIASTTRALGRGLTTARGWLPDTGLTRSNAFAQVRSGCRRVLGLVDQEPSGLLGAFAVLIVALLITLPFYSALGWPAQAVGRLVAAFSPSTCGPLEGNFASEEACGVALGVLALIGPVVVAAAMFVLRMPLRRALAGLFAAAPRELRFLSAPTIGLIFFTMGWAGVQFHFPERTGYVTDGRFPVVVALLTYATVRWGPLLQRELAGLLERRDAYPVRYRWIAMFAIPAVLAYPASILMSNPERDQAMVLISTVTGFLLLAPHRPSGAAAATSSDSGGGRAATLAAGALLAVGVFLLVPDVALASSHCFGAFDFDITACEASHHSAVYSTLTGLIGGVAVGTAVLVQGSTGDAGGGSITGGLGGPSSGGPDGPPRIRPQDLGLPPEDAWGIEVVVNNGEWDDGEVGQIWWNDRWIDLDEARERILEGFEAVAQRDAEREAFWEEAQRISDEWLSNRVAANEAEAAAERSSIRRREEAWEQLDRVERIAMGHDYGDIFERTDSVFDEDGMLDIEKVERLAEATRNRIGRDIAAPDEELAEGWLEDFVTTTASDAAHSTVIRIGTGVLSGGSSEIFFQSLAVAERLRAAAGQAVDRGEEYSTLDALRDAAEVVGRENLPLNTIQVLQDPRATWSDVALAGAMDIFVALDVIETGRNVRGSLGAARSGASLGDIATHRAPGLFDDLLRRSDDADRLWRDPMDVDWQTGGPRAGLDLDGLRRRGATIDGASARGVAGAPRPELHPPGGVQTRLPEEWGMRRPDAIHIQQVASDELVRLDVRPSTPRAPELLDAGLAVPKPQDIKGKTINQIDIDYLGRPADADGMAGYFDPPTPGVAPGAPPAGTVDLDAWEKAARRPPDIDEEVWDQVWDRYRQRQVEFANNAKDMERFAADGSFTTDANGVIRNPDGKGLTGDYDIFDIRNFDGSEVSWEVKQRVIDKLMNGPANAQHGAHIDWPEQAARDYMAGTRSSPLLSPKELDIYNRIIGGHQRGGEALIRFGAGQPRIGEGFTAARQL